MTKPLAGKFARLRAPDETGRLITAYAPLEEGGFVPAVFKASRVDMIVGLDEDVSALRLDDGVTIPVALPLASLKARLYSDDFRDGGEIDLMAVTGETVAEARQVTLSRRFNPVAAEESGLEVEKDLTIVAFIHHEHIDRKFHLARFSTADIAYFEPHTNRPQAEIFIKLKSGHAAAGFNQFYIPMPMSGFTGHLSAAVKEGRRIIDLSAHTRPRVDAKLQL